MLDGLLDLIAVSFQKDFQYVAGSLAVRVWVVETVVQLVLFQNIGSTSFGLRRIDVNIYGKRPGDSTGPLE